RLPLRVPRRTRSACSKLDTYSTVWSRTGKDAVYDTLIRRGTSTKLIFGRTTFIPEVPRLYVAPQQLRRVITTSTIDHHSHHPESPTLTRKGSLAGPRFAGFPRRMPARGPRLPIPPAPPLGPRALAPPPSPRPDRAHITTA